MTAHVVLVLVSHSAPLALGTLDLARQMAPDVGLVAVGGLPGGELGTSFDQVDESVRAALSEGSDVLVLADLGSAMLTVDSVVELLDDQEAARVRLADAPFVEGAVAAAVTAQGGGDLGAVLASAEEAGATFARSAGTGATDRAGQAAAPTGPGGDGPVVDRTVTLRNSLGLHARPAAVLARLVAGFDATVRVDGVDAASVLELMKLGATGGQEIAVHASGPDARAAVDAVAAAVESAFGEV